MEAFGGTSSVAAVISFEELAEGLAHGRLLLLDVLPEASFEQAHIPGSLNLPLERLAELEAPRHTALVVYCASES